MSLSNQQSYLISGEDALLHWVGNIHIGDRSQESEFIATNHRLIYNKNNMMKDIGYDRISSLEIGAETKTVVETSPTEMKLALGSLISGGLAALIGTMMGLSFGVIIVGYIVILGPVIYLWINVSDMDLGNSDKKTVYHIRVIRENERPLHIETEENIGTELNRIVRETQSG